jgi:hypothetical protein
VNADVKANTNVSKTKLKGQMRESDVRQQEEERERLEQERQREEEENQLNARLQLLELETAGKQYFKPSYGNKYILTFNRRNAFLVRGTPSTQLTRKVQDKNDKNITHEVPVMEYVHEVTHENGDAQTWSITSKGLQGLIIMELQKGFSTIEFMKEKTGTKPTDVKYHVKGVR